MQTLSLSQPDVLDLSVLSHHTGGDVDLQREILVLFRNQARGLMVRLEAMTDPKARADIAHTLRGSASGVGAAGVARAAEQLETRARAGEPTFEPVANLAAEISSVIHEIDGVLHA